MRIPRLYLDQDVPPGGRIELDARAAHYLGRVLRLPVGAELTLFTGRGTELSARLLRLDRRLALLESGPEHGVQRESPLRIALAQGIPRGDRMDHSLQKAVELGVSAFYPLTTERCGVALDGARLERRLAHWRGVIIAACAQCGRNQLPNLHPPQPLASFLGLEPTPCDLVLDPDGNQTPRTLAPPTRATARLLVGPEGGLTEGELNQARGRGFRGLRLGPRVLRTETAPLAAVAALQTLWGDLGG